MSEPAHRSLTRPAVCLSLALITALMPLTGCRKKPPTVVQTDKIIRRNLTELVTAAGKLQPVVQVKISPEVAGEITELPVKVGQMVHKGDLLVRIRRDLYEASLRSAEANFRSSQASEINSQSTARKAESEFRRAEELFKKKLISDSAFDEARTAYEVAKANVDAAHEQVEMARASSKKAEEDLLKTTIVSPIDGTVTKLNSERGERVVGTGMMAGTEIMSIADLTEMEARVEVGETDVVLVQLGQKVRVEVDSFRDRKFQGVVTQVAKSANTTGTNTQQESTKFEIRIHMLDKDPFLPGMSVTAEVETRYRTNVVTVPIQSVTTRLATNVVVKAPDMDGGKGRDAFELVSNKKAKDGPKPQDVVFVIENNTAKMVQVQRGISDDSFYEILSGLNEGQEVVTGSYKAISKELEDGGAIKHEEVPGDKKGGAKKG
ncbi:MAG TPA: efflux RND transporter periplasmic adaptor subunit [Candidatus Limnocylindria bacterium]|nr:efflux RND transporter periplasmic adaptor subunit [Candidatus Limnocylindria bacterium]